MCYCVEDEELQELREAGHCSDVKMQNGNISYCGIMVTLEHNI